MVGFECKEQGLNISEPEFSADPVSLFFYFFLFLTDLRDIILPQGAPFITQVSTFFTGYARKMFFFFPVWFFSPSPSPVG